MDVIGQFYVPVKLNCLAVLPEDRALFARLEKQRMRLDPSRARFPANGVYVVAPNGKVLAFFHDTYLHKQDPDAWCDGLVALAKQSHVRSKPVSRSYVPAELRTAQDSDLLLHIVARFCVDESGESLDARLSSAYAPPPSVRLGSELWRHYRQEVLLRRRVPTDEWVILRPQEWAALLPPSGARVGARYEVGPVRDLFLRRFCPPTHNFSLNGAVKDSSLTGVVERVNATTCEVSLSGSASMQQRWWLRADQNIASADFYGQMTLDAKAQRILSIRIATNRGTYGSATTLQVPYATVLYSVPPKSKTPWTVSIAP